LVDYPRKWSPPTGFRPGRHVSRVQHRET